MSEQQPEFVAALEADLASLAAADAVLERDAEVAERTRIERSSIALLERLRGAAGVLEIATRNGGRHCGAILEVGAGWVVITPSPMGQGVPASEHLIPLDAVVAVRGLGRAVSLATGILPPRSMVALVRSWCRDRSMVAVHLVDGTVLTGQAAACFADHLEISTGGGGPVVVPMTAISVMSR